MRRAVPHDAARVARHKLGAPHMTHPRSTRSARAAHAQAGHARQPEPAAKVARRAVGRNLRQSGGEDESASEDETEDDDGDEDDEDDGEGTVPHKDHPSSRSLRSNVAAVVPAVRPAHCRRMDDWLDGEGILPHPEWSELTGDLTPLPHRAGARYTMQYEYQRGIKNIQRVMVTKRLVATVAEAPSGVHVDDPGGAERTDRMVQVQHRCTRASYFSRSRGRRRDGYQRLGG